MANVKEEISRGGQMIHIAFAGMVMQPAGNLTAFLAFNRNAVAFAVRFAGQGILADFLIFEAFRFPPDGQVLARLVIGDQLAINRFELKAGGQLAARGFFFTMRNARSLPSRRFYWRFADRISASRPIKTFAS